MMNDQSNALQRALTSLGQQEPDRVPFFLTLTMHGAKELGLSIEEYYAKAEHMVEGQLRLRKRYGHDCLIGYAFAGAELSAWGSRPIYYPDGAPNAGPPVIHSVEEIDRLAPPEIDQSPLLQTMLELQRELAREAAGTVPVVGLVVSPVSLPVMQMGFGAYIRALYEAPEAIEQLFRINEAFCVAWANAQLAAGATFVAYADPVSSPTMIGPTFFPETGLPVMQRTLARIQGPVAVTYASADSLPLLDQLPATGAVAATLAPHTDLGAVEIVRAALGIAAEIDVYTNTNLVVEELACES